MTALVTWLNEVRELKHTHPLLVVAVFVVVFLEIHPLQDGNDRLRRVLTNLLMLQAGQAWLRQAIHDLHSLQTGVCDTEQKL